MLGPVLVSALFLFAGGLVALREHDAGGVATSTWAALALASVPCLWLLWRLIVTSL